VLTTMAITYVDVNLVFKERTVSKVILVAIYFF